MLFRRHGKLTAFFLALVMLIALPFVTLTSTAGTEDTASGEVITDSAIPTDGSLGEGEEDSTPEVENLIQTLDFGIQSVRTPEIKIIINPDATDGTKKEYNYQELLDLPEGESVLAKNGDVIQFYFMFAAPDEGEPQWSNLNNFTIDLPTIFKGVTVDNADNTEFEVTTGSVADGLLPISFNFTGTPNSADAWVKATLVLTESTTTEEVEIDMPGSVTIGIEVTPKPPVETGPVNQPHNPSSSPYIIKSGKNYGGYGEDTVHDESFYYEFFLNSGLYKQDYSNAFLEDTLPGGMRLFFPAAPGDDETAGNDEYTSAIKSFWFDVKETLIKYDSGENLYYLPLNAARSSEFKEYVESLEEYASRDLDDDYKVRGEDANENDSSFGRLYFSSEYTSRFIKESLNKEPGDNMLLPWYNAYISIGYRIVKGADAADDVVEFYVITEKNGDQTGGAPYEPSRSGDWTSDANQKCVPLYTSGTNVASLKTTETFKIIRLTEDTQPKENYSLDYNESESEYGVRHVWDWYFGTKKEWTVTVYEDVNVDYENDSNNTHGEKFTVALHTEDDSYELYGKELSILAWIYFDRNDPKFPDEATNPPATYENDATFFDKSDSTESEITYVSSGAGGSISSKGKSIDGKETSFVSLDPSAEIPYEIKFKKSGTAPSTSFRYFDRLSEYLEFVPNSIGIYRDASETDLATQGAEGKSATSSESDASNSLNTLVTFTEGTDGAKDLITITKTTNDITAVGGTEFTVKFKATLAEDVPYGAVIENTLGNTVKTYVDYKLTLIKTSENNAKLPGAEFKVSVSDAVGGTEHNLMKTEVVNGVSLITPLTDLLVTEDDDDGVSVTYRLPDALKDNQDWFFIKLIEKTPPSDYDNAFPDDEDTDTTDGDNPIWIEAKRNPTTKLMDYKIVRPLSGSLTYGLLDDETVDGGLVLTVTNVTEPNTPDHNTPDPVDYPLTIKKLSVETGKPTALIPGTVSSQIAKFSVRYADSAGATDIEDNKFILAKDEAITDNIGVDSVTRAVDWISTKDSSDGLAELQYSFPAGDTETVKGGFFIRLIETDAPDGYNGFGDSDGSEGEYTEEIAKKHPIWLSVSLDDSNKPTYKVIVPTDLTDGNAYDEDGKGLVISVENKKPDEPTPPDRETETPPPSTSTPPQTTTPPIDTNPPSEDNPPLENPPDRPNNPPPVPVPPENPPQSPPVPNSPGNVLVPEGDAFIEFDEDGIPQGRWEWQPEPPPGEWVFIPEPETPLGEMPKTDAAGVSTFILYVFGAFMLVSGIALSVRRKRALCAKK